MASILRVLPSAFAARSILGGKLFQFSLPISSRLRFDQARFRNVSTTQPKGRTRPSSVIQPFQRKCWKCDEAECIRFKQKDHTHSFFCHRCHCIQPVSSNANYFDLLGIPVAYDIDKKDLRSKYQSIMSHLHPDKFGNSSQMEQKVSASNSSEVVSAYSCLTDPVCRACYMLSLHSISVTETSSSDPELLLQTMEIRESIQEAVESDDRVAKLKDLKTDLEIQMEQIETSLSKSFENQDLVAAEQETVQLLFLQKSWKTVKHHI